MSYAITLGASASATVKTAASTDCSDAAVTGVKVIDDPIVKCCQNIRKGDGSAGDKAKGVAACIEEGVAVGVGAAAGAATASAICTATGVGAAIAPVCGMIGSALGGLLGHRVAGYSTGTKIVLAAGTALCGPSCGLLLAEMSEFLSDTFGPIISGIFDSGAANRRERQRRAAEWAAFEASEKAMREAEASTLQAWSESVNRIWDLYESLFKTTSSREEAFKTIGITNSYHSILRAFLAEGLPMENLPTETIKRYQAQGIPGCEQYGKLKNGSYGPISGVCPPFWWQKFQAAVKISNATAVAQDLAAQINDFFAKLQLAEIVIATRIATTAALQKAKAIAKAESDIDGFVLAARQAAVRAQVAAHAAASTTDVSVSRRAAQNAELALVTANRALQAIAAGSFAGNKPGQERADKATAALAAAQRYTAEAQAANKSNEQRRILVYGGVAACAAGAAYLLTR